MFKLIDYTARYPKTWSVLTKQEKILKWKL